MKLPGKSTAPSFFLGVLGLPRMSPRKRPGRSPAAQAGIEAGDVVTAINGVAVARSRDFATIISIWVPGSVIYLTTFRNGELMEIKLTLGYSDCKYASPFYAAQTAPVVDVARSTDSDKHTD
jgi:predicted metalloprotease with PDZ domain